MRVALYARVSTRDKGQNPETQLQPLRELAGLRNHAIVEEYTDLGWSGSKERRPQLDRLMAAARRKEFDAVLVWRFDRFARSTKHLLTALSEFEKLGVDFISLSESIDTSTAVGRMIFTILGAVAEMERALIRERVIAGVERAKREGKKLGRPRAIVDEQSIREEIASGASIQSTAKRWGVSRGVIRRLTAQKADDAACSKPVIALSGNC